MPEPTEIEVDPTVQNGPEVNAEVEGGVSVDADAGGILAVPQVGGGIEVQVSPQVVEVSAEAPSSAEVSASTNGGVSVALTVPGSTPGTGGGMAFYLVASDPSSGFGNDGDLAFNTVTGGWLTKSSGTWSEFTRGLIEITNKKAFVICPDAIQRGSNLTP